MEDEMSPPATEIDFDEELEAAKAALENVKRKFEHVEHHWKHDIGAALNRAESAEEDLRNFQKTEDLLETILAMVKDVDRGILTVAELVRFCGQWESEDNTVYIRRT